MASRDELLTIALRDFAAFGYLGTSLASIAQSAGTSKSNILYHFANKEALLEAALEPALHEFDDLLATLGAEHDQPPLAFGRFVDALMRHREAVIVFLSHRAALPDVAIFDRGNALIDRVAATLIAAVPSERQLIRLSVGLAGTAFLLSMRDAGQPGGAVDDALLRDLLVETLVDLTEGT